MKALKSSWPMTDPLSSLLSPKNKSMAADTEVGYRKKTDISKSIHSKIKKLYREKVDENENNSKIIRAWEALMPIIDTMIIEDWNNAGSQFKLIFDKTQKPKAEYFCTPQLYMSNISKIPTAVQESLFEDFESDDYEPIYGIIPEIDIAFTVSRNIFSYWNLSSNWSIAETIEIETKQIVSVGYVKPPEGFFQSRKWENLIFLGADSKLIAWEVTFKNQYSKGKSTKIERIDLEIPWENVIYEKIVWTSNWRTFVGWKDAKINEVEFNVISSWFWNKTRKVIKSQNKDNSTSFISKLIPDIFKFSEKQIETIQIDENRHLLYVLSFKEYNDNEENKPWVIDIYYLGPFGKSFSKVTTITQTQLCKQLQDFSNTKDKLNMQVIGLHSVGIAESSEIHFVLTTSKGMRIYISLEWVYFYDDKMRELNEKDYTAYWNHRPDGEWKIVGAFYPPLPRDIIGFTKDQERWCSYFDFTNQDFWILKTYWSKGSIYFDGLNTLNGNKVLLYINDSEAWIKKISEISTRRFVSEKFWAIQIPNDIRILEIQKKPLELYVDEDILNCIGYLKRRVMSENSNNK